MSLTFEKYSSAGQVGTRLRKRAVTRMRAITLPQPNRIVGNFLQLRFRTIRNFIGLAMFRTHAH